MRVTPPLGAIRPLPDDLGALVLAGSPDAILVCDRDGTLRLWNAAAERLFGHRAEEAVGASLDLVIPERLRARHWAGWDAAMKTGVTRYGGGHLLAVPAMHKDGRRLSIEFSIQLLPGAGRRVDWVVAIVRDVTERWERQKALRRRARAAGAGASDTATTAALESR